MSIVITILVIVLLLVFATGALYINYLKSEQEEKLRELKRDEKRQEELKESINTGNHTDDINNMLNILCKPKK